MKQPDRIAIKNLIQLFDKYFLPRRNNHHNHRFGLLDKTRRNQTSKRFLAETDSNQGKKGAFEGITIKELLISKILTAIMDTKLRDKLMKVKEPEIKRRQQSK